MARLERELVLDQVAAMFSLACIITYLFLILTVMVQDVTLEFELLLDGYRAVLTL